MARQTTRMLQWGLLAAIGVFLLVLAYIVISQSGILPGDTGNTAAATTEAEALSGGQLALGAWPWALVVLSATALLGVAIAYGQYRASKASKEQLKAGDAASHKLYADEDRR